MISCPQTSRIRLQTCFFFAVSCTTGAVFSKVRMFAVYAGASLCVCSCGFLAVIIQKCAVHSVKMLPVRRRRIRRLTNTSSYDVKSSLVIQRSQSVVSVAESITVLAQKFCGGIAPSVPLSPSAFLPRDARSAIVSRPSVCLSVRL